MLHNKLLKLLTPRKSLSGTKR